MKEVGLVRCKSKSLEAGCKSLGIREAGIDEKILVRLEVTDLIRCKSVCKLWNSLISSDGFVKSHLKRQIPDTRIAIFNDDYNKCIGECGFSRQCEGELIGSCNGLVCISLYNTEFLVVNPSTREVKQLMHRPRYLDSYYDLIVFLSGFGYDSSIDDFKVAIGCAVEDLMELKFYVLELKKNIWRSVDVERDYRFLYGNGILCNGALHWWLDPDSKQPAIASFDLSKEVFTRIPLPISVFKWYYSNKLHHQWEWSLGTMKDRLCVFRFPNKPPFEEIEIRVLRNNQVSWKRELLPHGYDTNKTTMEYFPFRNFLSGHAHIWILEEGSAAPVLVQSIDPLLNEDDIHGFGNHEHKHEHIRLSTYSECNYNYDSHVFVKSLVSPHGMGNENGSCNKKEIVKRKASPDGNVRSVKSRRKSLVSPHSMGNENAVKLASKLVGSFTS